MVTERINYKDIIPLSIKDKNTISDEYDVLAKVIQQPNCLECKIAGNGQKIVVEIEREFVVQVIGETKMLVRVDPNWANHNDDDDDAWDYQVTDEELENVKPNFLNKKD